ncbi:hypothetical protein EI94DRAFT_1708394 [Lactarius quietus]|nr:hypothetical protein EI94DRAFT_1708394 [Lactarius quietus]
MVTVIMIIVVGFVVMVVIGQGQGPVWCVAVLYMLKTKSSGVKQRYQRGVSSQGKGGEGWRVANRRDKEEMHSETPSKGDKGCHEALIAILGLTKAICRWWKRQKGKGLMNDFGGHNEGEDKKDMRQGLNPQPQPARKNLCYMSSMFENPDSH